MSWKGLALILPLEKGSNDIDGMVHMNMAIGADRGAGREAETSTVGVLE